MDIDVVWKGKHYQINTTENIKLVELKYLVEEATGIKSDAQKLLGSGRLLRDDELLAKFLQQHDRQVIQLLASKHDEVESRPTLSEISSSRPAIKSAVPVRTTLKRTELEFKFNDIKALTKYPDYEKAQSILERLADEKGIQGIMQKHHLNVGLLTEFDPAIMEPKLGENWNHGQVIRLRLRETIVGPFLNYESIRTTLCHELTHNLYGDHDNKFWAFYRLLLHEYDTFDPFSQRNTGHKLGGQDVDIYNPELHRKLVNETDSGAVQGNTDGIILGGKLESDRSMRDLMLEAAQLRTKKSE